MFEHPARPGGEPEAFVAFTACFGPEALNQCAAMVGRMTADSALAARVTDRHAQLAEQYAALNEGCSLATARLAGHRAMLVVLLLESGDRYVQMVSKPARAPVFGYPITLERRF
jgi:hypothetical protein